MRLKVHEDDKTLTRESAFHWKSHTDGSDVSRCIILNRSYGLTLKNFYVESVRNSNQQ